ncbi:Ldh family oxidoreductase [Bordetella sp. BOR01]|uniref:Ldh family oxidoreductase n=1 Tax=Bordetella sp. BOR01 TaxID=2854779 RepID=UPI001C474908|nr:Ldh family oxidoreductase [Bordetella sp. BOR01]MBV7484220.1 Ldh family oxidoreductase [Bordetella sp. BOR01]
MTVQGDSRRYGVDETRAFAQALFRAAGLDEDKARTVGEILLEADLMGHATHGLALAPAYLDAAASGALLGSGEPDVVADRGACITWRGKRLPGPWLTAKAVDLALDRVQTYGTVTVAISDSHHIGALAAYLTRATDRGCLAMIASSMPSLAGVAPYGGTQAVFTPNPIAAGIPTEGDPILLDISASITTINMTRQLVKAGQVFPQAWAMDAQGNPSTDPQVALSQGGTLLPVGGLDHGHKGYGWALLVEALSTLSGFGRADQPAGTCVSVFIQVIDPGAFGGQADFARQMGWLADACKTNPPRPGVDRVRLPGERGLAIKRESLVQGVALSDSIMQGLSRWAQTHGVPLPQALPADD